MRDNILFLLRKLIVKPNSSLHIMKYAACTAVLASILTAQIATAASVTVREGGQDVATGCTLNSMSGTPTNVIIDVAASCLPQGGSSGVTIYPHGSAGSPLAMNEGTSQNVSVALHTQPSANVTVSLLSQDTTELTLNTSSLTFTPTNFFQPQSVLLTAEQDDVNDGNNSVNVTGSTSSSDSTYSGITTPTVFVNVLNSTVNNNVDSRLHAWNGPVSNPNLFVVDTTAFDSFSTNRSFYPDCQRLAQNPATTTCDSNSTSLSSNNWQQAHIFSERLPFGTAAFLDQPHVVKLALAELNESGNNWDAVISTRPGEFRVPSTNPAINPNANNEVNCKKLGLPTGNFALLRSDHTSSAILGYEANSCVLEAGKVYYLDIKPSSGEGCGTSKICRLQVTNDLVKDQIVDLSLFPYTLP